MDIPTFPARWTEPNFKGSKAEARAERESVKDAVREKEDRNKSAARKRDGWMCRFPRCSCHRKRLSPEAAHIAPKGAGGDHGIRSTAANIICLCRGRHKESRVSIHAGTLRCEPLTEKGANGAVRWWVNIAVLDNPFATEPQWVLVATETCPGYLEPLSHEQAALLERIAELQA